MLSATFTESYRKIKSTSPNSLSSKAMSNKKNAAVEDSTVVYLSATNIKIWHTTYVVFQYKYRAFYAVLHSSLPKRGIEKNTGRKTTSTCIRCSVYCCIHSKKIVPVIAGFNSTVCAYK